jgi:hypothetical protein
MWDDLLRQLPKYRSAVLNARDDEGYPFSLRCRPLPDEAAQTLLLDLAADLPLQPGPASVLCHKHDAKLWNQQSFLLRGKLEQAGGRWLFRPTQLIPGVSPDLVSTVRFVVASRRNAAAYLAKRGLARPAVPWQEINRVKAEAKRAG